MQVRTNARYYNRLAAAMVRGKLADSHPDDELFQKRLEDLSEPEMSALIRMGAESDLPLQSFLRTEELPPVRKIMSYVRGINPDNLLDVGMGKGTFVWRLLDEYKLMPVHTVDVNERRVEDVEAVYRGGVINLKPQVADVADLSAFPDMGFDCVTCMEVLEYVDDVGKAVDELVRVTKRFLILVVPTTRSEEAGQKHLLTKEHLKEDFKRRGILQLKFEEVPNYLLLVARK